jgi:hypothetical protein
VSCWLDGASYDWVVVSACDAFDLASPQVRIKHSSHVIFVRSSELSDSYKLLYGRKNYISYLVWRTSLVLPGKNCYSERIAVTGK